MSIHTTNIDWLADEKTEAEKSAEFFASQGYLEAIVDHVWFTSDPFRCISLVEEQRDEYLGYAQRFIARVSDSSGALSCPLLRPSADETNRYVRTLMVELVRRSFHPSQLISFRRDDGVELMQHASPEAIAAIADAICNELERCGKLEAVFEEYNQL